MRDFSQSGLLAGKDGGMCEVVMFINVLKFLLRKFLLGM